VITLSNGHRFRYMVASGALGFDGKGWPWEKPLVWLGLVKPKLFTVVLKTLTRHPRVGNLSMWKPWTCVRLIPGGSVNKVGLTNPGIEWWCRDIGPSLDFKKVPLVGSIFGEEQELVEMTEMLNKFDFVAIEINVSCPNADHDSLTEAIVKCAKAVRAVSRHPVIIKVSVDQDYLSIVYGLEETVEAISFNSVPWKTAFPNGEVSPLWELEKRIGGGGGGVSGKPAQKLNWEAVRLLANQDSLPIIGPSVMDFSDLAQLRLLGAAAASFGAIHLRTPWKPTSIVRKDMNDWDGF
jgi:dihydroorotate dehydrogenase (NAD+) catalytic subunit